MSQWLWKQTPGAAAAGKRRTGFCVPWLSNTVHSTTSPGPVPGAVQRDSPAAHYW